MLVCVGKGWGGGDVYFTSRILAIDSAVGKTQQLISSPEGFLFYAVQHHKQSNQM